MNACALIGTEDDVAVRRARIGEYNRCDAVHPRGEKTGELLVSLYEFVVTRYVIPVIEAHKAEGREQGRAEVRAEWQAWNERRLAAEREGRDFTEPTPQV